jgi:hypothetical protein
MHMKIASTCLALAIAACSTDHYVGIVDPKKPPAAPARGLQLRLESFTASVLDVSLCRAIKMPIEEAIFVNRVEFLYPSGVHDAALYTSPNALDDQVFDCRSESGQAGWVPLASSGTAKGAIFDLADAVYRIEPKQQLILQVNVVNSAPVQGETLGLWVNLYQTDGAGKPIARVASFDNTRIAIPPYTSGWTTSKTCLLSHDIQVYAMTSHFHELGRTFRAHRVDAAVARDDEIYCSGPDCPTAVGRAHGWYAPLFETYDPPMPLLGGDVTEQLRFSCSYDNDSDSWRYFGGIASSREHCRLLVYYANRDPSDDTDVACAEIASGGGW